MDRATLPAAETWNLGELYADNDAFEAAFAQAQSAIKAFLPIDLTDAGVLAALMTAYFDLNYQVEKLYVYAHLKQDLDNGDATAQAQADRSETLAIDCAAATAFLSPSILALDAAVLEGWLADTQLAFCTRYVRELVRARPHTLPAEQEALLAQSGELAGTPKSAFDLLETLDLQLPDVVVGDKSYPLTHAQYRVLMENPDREVRRTTYATYYTAFAGHRNTIAALLAGSVKADNFFAKARNYDSALASALFDNDIPQSVYHATIAACRDSLPALHEYIALKGRALGVTPEMFDFYVPLVPEPFAVDYDRARELVLRATAPLGEEYAKVLQASFDQRWIDVHETPSKSPGAYAWGVWGVHPYVLLNHRDTPDAAFTLAHEMGHAMHSHLSNKNQTYQDAQYSIFAAEVASTVNEMLLLDLCIREAATQQESVYWLNFFCESVRTTVLRQVMFAEFELAIHTHAQGGGALVHDWLCETYAKLNADYHGIPGDEYIALEWARIPHFYNAYYVYQYATGFSAAVAIANRIQREGKPAADDYLRFLSAGGSLPPIQALKLAGVDLSTPAPVADCLTLFAQRVKELAARL